MSELIARGQADGQSRRRTLRMHESLVVGREPSNASPSWEVPWESRLSRRHFEVTCEGDAVKVVQQPAAVNPMFFHGEPQKSFTLRRGEYFVVGRTTFTWQAEEAPSPTPTPENAPVVHAFTVSADELRQVPFRDAPHRLDVLRHLTKVIFGVVDDAELFAQATNMMLEGIRRADAVAVVALDDAAGPGQVRVLHSDRRYHGDAEFRPSRQLIREALVRQHKSAVHVWAGAQDEAEQQFTMQGDFDWAFCTPIGRDLDDRTAVYVAGRSAGLEPAALLAPWQTNELSEDVKFAELVADILAALRQTQVLQHRQAVLGHFFSPNVLKVLSSGDPEQTLAPKETQVTALFCDLRGFSRRVETSSEDLSSILKRVSAALGVMSTAILQQKGVVADFLGDCAMGFWGWPIAQPDDVERACLAALAIRAAFERFAEQPEHPLADFRVGVGIATGRAVAGQIGSQDQAKVTAFGPCVNLASRLEGMTKILRVPVLIDEETAHLVVERTPAESARCRRIARVRPYGLEQALVVSELLPPAATDPLHSAENVADYEAALSAFLAGDWRAAYEKLHRIPPQDSGKDFLMSYILQHNHTPPAGWDGVIPLDSKR